MLTKVNFNDYFYLRNSTLLISTKCNLKCTYCFEDSKTKKNMSVEDAKIIINRVLENFEKTTLKDEPGSSFSVSFFGGEPLMNIPAFEAIIEECNKKPYPVYYGITTNMTILTDELLDLIIENNIGLLCSIDGIKESHDKFRCNSYDIAIDNIKKIIYAGGKHQIEVRMTIMPSEVKNLFNGIKSLIDVGINNFAPELVHDVEWSEDALKEYEHQLELIYDYLIKIYSDPNNKENISIKTVDDFLYLCFNIFQDDLSPCGFGGKFTVSIGPDGELCSCHQNHIVKGSTNLVLGNILTEELDLDKLDTIRIPRERDFCYGCSVRNVCRGGCPSENYVDNGSFDHPHESWCKSMHIIERITKKYQSILINCQYIRNKRINELIINLNLQKDLENLSKLDINSEEFLFKLSEIQTFVFGNEQIILPSFKIYLNQFLDASYIASIESLINSLPEDFEVSLSELSSDNG